jgi:hypothetical protein
MFPFDAINFLLLIKKKKKNLHLEKYTSYMLTSSQCRLTKKRVLTLEYACLAQSKGLDPSLVLIH